MLEYSDNEMNVFRKVLAAEKFDEVISTTTAREIASWWHSPASLNSTALSTRGIVMCSARLGDFADQDEYNKASKEHKRALEALDRYLTHCQSLGMVRHLAWCTCEHLEN